MLRIFVIKSRENEKTDRYRSFNADSLPLSNPNAGMVDLRNIISTRITCRQPQLFACLDSRRIPHFLNQNRAQSFGKKK